MSKKGSMSISFKNLKDINRQVRKISEASQKALDLTIKDTVSRAPAQVTKVVTSKFNIKKSEMTAAGKSAVKNKKRIGSIKVSGNKADSIALVYTGSRLTPIHFGMRPTTLPANKRRYKLTVEVFKGKRKPLKGPSDRPVFLGSNNAENMEDRRDIPFQRYGKRPHPIFSVKAVGIPQMIDNKEVRTEINKNISELMGKRYEHQAKRAIRKVK